MAADTIDGSGSDQGSGAGVIETVRLGIGAAIGRVERSYPTVIRRNLGLRVLLYGLFSLAVGAGAVAAATATGVSSPVLLGGGAVVATMVPLLLGPCGTYTAVTTVPRSAESTGDGTYRVDMVDDPGDRTDQLLDRVSSFGAQAGRGASTSAVATDD